MSHNKCKVEIPNQLPESGLTRVQLKTWKESMEVYLKQNEDFLLFLPGGKYENWESAEENKDRIINLKADDKPTEDTADGKNKLLAKRQKDLLTMLNLIGRKVDQYDYDDVMNLSKSVQSIWEMIELVYDIGRKGVHFLELSKIKYESGESPAKYYKKIHHHFMDNMYKKNDILKYKKDKVLPEDEKPSPTLLNFILYYTIDSIDTRLMRKIKDKWGHLMDKNTGLHDLKDTILKAIPDLLTKLDTKDFEANALGTNLSAFSPRGKFRGRGRGRGQGGNFRPNQQQQPYGQVNRQFCRLCQAARCPPRIYTSHNVANCTRWSRKDVEDLRVMMCDLQTDPNDWSDSEPDQD